MLKGLLSIFLKLPCSLCQRPASEIVCSYCQQKLKSCQLNHSQKLSLGNLSVFAWGRYDGTLKRAIALMKYDRLPEMGSMLGQWLGHNWLSSVSHVNKSKIVVVPIPLHPEKLQQRGFNQAEKIAQGFCQITGYSLQPKILNRVKNSEAMFNLNSAQRKANINDAFAVGNIPPRKMKQKSTPRLEMLPSRKPLSRSILLIDDIYTTGATVSEAAKVLQKQGMKVTGVAVVATPQKVL
ncbi:MAG: ComF family protein [Xenococcaceae cyanobacterium MO_207.B15]|nr:ComF family protein [Xenococcaceae cyanobacterium MO_207.B15]